MLHNNNAVKGLDKIIAAQEKIFTLWKGKEPGPEKISLLRAFSELCDLRRLYEKGDKTPKPFSLQKSTLDLTSPD